MEQVVALRDEIDLPFGEVRSKLGAGLRATTASRACATGSAAPTSGASARASGAPTRPIQIVSAYVLSRFRESEEDVRRLIEHAPTKPSGSSTRSSPESADPMGEVIG